MFITMVSLLINRDINMTRKQGNDTILRQISIIHEQDDRNNNDNYDNTIYNAYNKKRRHPSSSNQYKIIDKEKKKLVYFWSYFSICFLAIGLCVASFSVPALQQASLKGLRMWQWCLLIAALLSGPLLSYFIVKFIQFFIDRDFSIRENVIYYVVGLGESAAVVLWFSMILLAWLWVVDEPSYLGMPQEDIGKIKKKYATTFHIITVTLITFILGSFLWLLKDLVIMKAKSSFHIRRFFDRIKPALLHQYVIEELSRGRRGFRADTIDSVENSVTPVVTSSCDYNEHSFRKEGLGKNEKRLVDLSSFEDVSQENVSCWGMKLLIQAIIENPNLSYYYRVIQDGGGYERRGIDNEDEAVHAANTIFTSVAAGGVEASHIGRQKLSRYFPDGKLDEVMRCLLEGAHSKQLEAEVFKKWMLKVYRYREALVRALDANKKLFKSFSRFVDVLLVFLIFALWLIMLRVETRKVIFLVGTAIVGSAVIFGDTCKRLLDNLLFVFLVHPFDIGDCCLIDNTPVIIEEIDLLTTVVLTFDNEKRHYPNAFLSGQSISNYTRSPNMGDNVTLSLDINTPIEKIDILKEQTKSYIDKNSQFWYPDHHWVIELENMSTMKITLRLQHTINYHELNERQSRKTELVLELKDILIKLGLTTNK